MNIPIKKTKLLIVYLGGAQEPFANRSQSQRWFSEFSEIQMMIDADMMSLAPSKKDDLQSVHLQRAVRRVVREWNKYDGFIISLPYAEYMYYSNVLSFMFGNTVEKPVVLTTSLQLTQQQGSTNIEDVSLKANMLNASVVAGTKVAGVAVIGGTYIVPAPHAVHEIHENTDVITSVDNVTVGHIDFGVHLEKSTHIGNGAKPDIAINIGKSVERFRLYDIQNQYDEIARLRSLKECDAIIIDGGPQLQMSITKELPKNIPTLLISHDTVFLHDAEQLSPVSRLTPSAAAAKLTWLVGQKYKEKLMPLFSHEYIGELLHTV